MTKQKPDDAFHIFTLPSSPAVAIKLPSAHTYIHTCIHYARYIYAHKIALKIGRSALTWREVHGAHSEEMSLLLQHVCLAAPLPHQQLPQSARRHRKPVA